MPFISVASNLRLIESGVYKKIYDFFKFESAIYFISVFGFSIVGFYALRAIYNLVYIYILNSYSKGMYRLFSKRLFTTFLRIPYKLFAQKNTGELMQITNNEAGTTADILSSILMMFSEAFTALFLYVFMLTVNWKMTLVLTGILLAIVLFILRIFVKKAKKHGTANVEANRTMFRILNESFGNIKFIKLKNISGDMEKEFDHALAVSTSAQILGNTLYEAPKAFLETIGFSMLILAVLFILWVYKSAEAVIPIIAAYALALYRILPSINRIIQQFNNIAYRQHSLDVLFEHINLNTEIEGEEELVFEKTITLDNIFFSYPASANVLQNISLEIKKGEKVAFVGESGCGKSTLVDVLIGIHKPDTGSLFIDGVEITSANVASWKKRIGYIPQDIYLFDGTVGENVAFGSMYEDDKLQSVLRMANIWDFLAEKNGLDTLVGEDGIQLSGGQKQRIGIARALYGGPEIIVLDEATSALDNNTESKIMDEIYRVSENKTLIVIAHRLSTVERCERRIQMAKGRIIGQTPV
jgi:ATP-binding cassette subfamily B protein/ATP-binding cassette subfamily C protein